MPYMRRNHRVRLFRLATCSAALSMASCAALGPADGGPVQSRTASLEEQVQQLRADNEVLHDRLLATWRDLWPLLSLQEQRARIPALLAEEDAMLRAFAIDRIAVLLRDGDAEESILRLLVGRLGDPDPLLREATATLLPEIEFDGLPEVVAEKLREESDQRVAAMELNYLRDRPAAGTADVVLLRLNQGPAEAAAEAMVSLLENELVEPSLRDEILIAVRRSNRLPDQASMLTLLATLGTPDDRRRLMVVLDGGTSPMRRAVAKGFAMARVAGPLVQRADDKLIYPIAMEALDRQGDLASLLLILRRSPPEESLIGARDAAAVSVAATIAVDDLLIADATMASLSPPTLRIAVLLAGWTGEERSDGDRKMIARQLVPALIEEGRATEAVQLLESFDDGITEDDLLQLKFIAALRAGAWNAAADVRPEPQSWIDQWMTISSTDADAADLMRRQIILRFEATLDASQRETLGLPEPIVADGESVETP